MTGHSQDRGGGSDGGFCCCFLGGGAFLWLFSILPTTCCNTYGSCLAARAQLGGSEARHLNQGDAAISLNTTTTRSSHSNPFKPTAARQLVLAFLFLYGTSLITKTGWLWSAAQKLQKRKSSHSGGGKKKVSTSGEFHTFHVILFWNPELLLLSEILKRCFLPLINALLV